MNHRFTLGSWSAGAAPVLRTLWRAPHHAWRVGLEVRGRGSGLAYPKALRTQHTRLLGPKTILYSSFGLF